MKQETRPVVSSRFPKAACCPLLVEAYLAVRMRVGAAHHGSFILKDLQRQETRKLIPLDHWIQ